MNPERQGFHEAEPSKSERLAALRKKFENAQAEVTLRKENFRAAELKARYAKGTLVKVARMAESVAFDRLVTAENNLRNAQQELEKAQGM